MGPPPDLWEAQLLRARQLNAPCTSSRINRSRVGSLRTGKKRAATAASLIVGRRSHMTISGYWVRRGEGWCDQTPSQRLSAHVPDPEVSICLVESNPRLPGSGKV